MIENLYQAILHSVDYSDKTYSSCVKKGVAYSFENAELKADVSLVVTKRSDNKPFRIFLFVDATKVFESGTVDDAVKSMPYRYGKPDQAEVIVHFAAENGFTKEAITACKQHPWMRLLRLVNGKEDTILHRAYHTPGTFDRDQEDFLAEDAKKSQVYADEQFRSLVAYWDDMGVPLKKGLKFQPDCLSNEQIAQRVNSLLTEVASKGLSGRDILYDVADFLEVTIVPQQMDDDQLGYYSLEDNAIFLNKNQMNHENYRDRFTLAHELGHRFLHKDLLKRYNMERTDDDSWGNICNALMTGVSQGWLEWQANQFASYLLLPEEQTRRAFIQCAIELSTQMCYAENMRKVAQMGRLWADPHDKFEDNRRAAFAMLTSLSNRMFVSKEALRYRLLDLGLVQAPNTSKSKLVGWLTE